MISRPRVIGARVGGRACELAWTTAVLAGLLSLPACGGGSGGGSSGSSAFDLPTVVSSGGPVLDSPRVQPIYFPGFAFQTDVDGFLAKMARSSYWPTVVKEYGVGDLTVMPSLVTSVSAGAALTDTDIPGLLAQVFTSSGGALGTPSRDTIYLLLFPSSTTITAQGQVMCGASAPSGYHTEFSLGGVTVPGIVVPSCPNYAGDTTLTGVQALTPTISHEIVESATDPFTTTVARLLRPRRAPHDLERRDQRRRGRRPVRERDAGPDHARRHRLPGAADLVERCGQRRDRAVRAGPAR